MTQAEYPDRKQDKSRRVALMRAGARLAAVQALYQWEAAGATPETIVKEFADHRIGRSVDGVDLPMADLKLFSELVLGAAANVGEIDNMIAGMLVADWSVERLEATLRAILRCGTYELAHRPGIPARVTIAEYVAVADAFFGARETGLANGVLDQLARALRPEEMEHAIAGQPTSR